MRLIEKSSAMSETSRDIKFAKLETKLEFIESEIGELKKLQKENFDEIQKSIRDLGQSLSSLRYDVNSALSMATENKVVIHKVKERLEKLEGSEQRKVALIGFFKWFVGAFGLSGVIATIVALAQTLK